MMEEDRAFYREHLVKSVLPFWERAFDDEEGGLFTCWTNDGKTLVSTDKYVWSQARMLWILSYMLDTLALDEAEERRYRKRASSLYALLKGGAILSGKDEGCAFVLSRSGEPKEAAAGSGLYTSLYADCFVALGFARWAKVSGKSAIIGEACAIFDKTLALIAQAIVKTEPYPLAPDSDAHGIHMITCNTAIELARALESFGDSQSARYWEQGRTSAHTILGRFVDRKRTQIIEVLNPSKQEEGLLERHRNPGHTIESIWFMLDALEGERVDELHALLLSALEGGWDEQYGGILRYVDCDGGEPIGEAGSDAFSHLVASTWDYKLWWPHAEALYATAKMASLTEDPALWRWYERIKEYTFSTFPSLEEGMEWIQIRTRTAEAEEAVVALPVKDPFHITRSLLLLITDKGLV